MAAVINPGRRARVDIHMERRFPAFFKSIRETLKFSRVTQSAAAGQVAAKRL
jgi:hypothetical protein